MLFHENDSAIGSDTCSKRCLLGVYAIVMRVEFVCTKQQNRS